MLERASARHVPSIMIVSILLAAATFGAVSTWPLHVGSNAAQTRNPLVIAVADSSPTAQATLAASGTVLTPDQDELSPPKTANPQFPLLGRRIGLDPGHGPREDLGAVLVDLGKGAIILSEAEFNLDVALRARDILIARGASVVLIRESADTFTAPWPVDANSDGETGDTFDDLQQRVDTFNNFQAEVFLSIHANGGLSDPPAEQDLQVLYCGTDDCAFPAESKRLGQLVLDQLQTKLATATGAGYGGSLLTDLSADSSDPPEHLFVLGPVNLPRHVRATSMPGVLAESLYVTSTEQAAKLTQDNGRQAIALAYADALQAYLAGK
jgi:N-acetylmuramoyl-L-alanine amidase